MSGLAVKIDQVRVSGNEIELEKMMEELDSLKKQSERLDLVNKLHGRLAGVLNLTGMIETYSVWLMPLVNHELIGYNNISRNKKHLFCSNHGPERRKAIALAERLIAVSPKESGAYTKTGGRYAYRWSFETVEDSGILLLLKNGRELSCDEIDLINESLDVLAECLRRGLEYEDLFEKASHDPLTGLCNRRVFAERIPQMMESAKRYGHPLSMVSMDLDRFKDINDNLGHQRGDEALVEVADLLKSAVRSSDLLVRMGGDEFLIVLDQTSLQSARILAERLCAGVDKLEIWATDRIKLGVSIGLSELDPQEDLNAWMERTDDILYHAKDLGKSQVATS